MVLSCVSVVMCGCFVSLCGGCESICCGFVSLHTGYRPLSLFPVGLFNNPYMHGSRSCELMIIILLGHTGIYSW